VSKKIAVSISDRNFEYLNQVTGNRSAFIDNLISKQQQQDLETRLEQAYIKQENDPEFQQEIADWDCTVGDGISEKAD
jgi:predicted Zn-dependent protease